ncbi:MAG: hypothetical protein ACRCSL_16725 [Microbacterium sp.]
MSTKIRHANYHGIPTLPVFAIDTKGRETRYFGRIAYSPLHHLDALGRPIPARATANGYKPLFTPTTTQPLTRPRPRPRAK